MQVYRVETSNGLGVFWSGLIGEIEATIPSDDLYPITPRRHPAPTCDSGLCAFWANTPHSERSAYHFGFASMESLLTWFDSERFRREMKERGAMIRVYEVPDVMVKEGDHQLVFHMGNAMRVDEWPIPVLAAA